MIRALAGCARAVAGVDANVAVRVAGACDRARELLGVVLWPNERQCLDSWQATCRRALRRDAYDRANQNGRASTLDQAISMVESLTPRVSTGDEPVDGLSAREREVAILVARGLTNKQVAAKLVVSPGTVRSHVEHVLTKLDLHSRAQIAVWATQQGLMQ
jgi:non-specific serine/threonine protein kinase